MNNKKVALLDYCMSDYFNGYHLPVVSVCVNQTITCEDMAWKIQSEINATFDYLDLSKEDEALYKTYCNELKAKGSEIFIEQTQLEEDEECAVAYFGIINPVYSNGLMFLNP